MKDIIKITITGHRKKYIKDHKKIKQDIEYILDKYFSEKNKYLFNIGLSDGIDLWFWYTALKKWYKVDSHLVKSDEEGRWYRDDEDYKLFNYILKNSQKIYKYDDYLERNTGMVKKCEWLIAYLTKKWCSGTLDTIWKFLIMKNLNKLNISKYNNFIIFK